MKAKKLRGKLSFNKQTIAHLGNFEIKDVLGGIPGDTVPNNSGYPVCPTFTCLPSDCSGVHCC
jgi:hypothetical protein